MLFAMGDDLSYGLNTLGPLCPFSTNSKELLNIGTINSIELVSSSARVTSAKFQKALVRSEWHRDTGTHRPDPQTPKFNLKETLNECDCDRKFLPKSEVYIDFGEVFESVCRHLPLNSSNPGFPVKWCGSLKDQLACLYTFTHLENRDNFGSARICKSMATWWAQKCFRSPNYSVSLSKVAFGSKRLRTG